MNRLALLCGALLIFAGVASAQDYPKFDAFGGYSYLHVSENGVGENFNGGSGSLAYNFTPMLGVVADFGGYHWSGPFGEDENLTINVVSYLFGPRVSLRHGKFTPFAQALFGGAHGSFNANESCSDARVRGQGGCGSGSTSDNSFSLAVGGGLDWNATTHIGIRLIQAEYLMTQFLNDTQNNARISTGVTIRW
jgi:opacity protein-like surface antigen